MLLLILGLLFWVGAHYYKRLLPAHRAQLGDKKAAPFVALGIVAGIVLMVIGYKAADTTVIWSPPYELRHLTHLLVLIGIFMMTPAPKKGVLLTKMRHPMLTGFGLWAFAHLLVNGDLASMVLFGGLLAWALGAMVLINRSEPEWTGRPRGTLAKDAIFAVASLITFGAIAYAHSLVGPSVFG